MKISIITVTYNAEATVERTLDSVAGQTYADIEHIVVDGVSRDRTAEIVRRRGYEDVRAGALSNESVGARGCKMLLSEPDRGLYDAMNKGIRMATGDYLCFLNSGDTLHCADTIAHVVEAASVGSVGVVYGDTHIVDAQGAFVRNRRLTPPECLTWRSFRQGMLVCHQAFYVNRSIAPSYDTHFRFSADFDWCIRCLREGEKRGLRNVYVREPLADYLNEGMTTANHSASLCERFAIMARHYGLLSTVAFHLWFVLRAIFRK